MLARFVMILILSSLTSDYLSAQNHIMKDSLKSAQTVDKLISIPEHNTPLDNSRKETQSPGGFEINLSIEEEASDETIGEFYLENQYNLEITPDSAITRTREFIADMRAKIAFKQVINIDYSKVPLGEYPFIIQFSNNIFTGFKPIIPLISFGF